jgi:hypothetical protein
MRYRVTLAAVPVLRSTCGIQAMFVPGTDQVMELSPSTGLGNIIWEGYVEMREAQKKRPLSKDSLAKINVPETSDVAGQMDQFREAVDLFMRFLVGDGRDNCLKVKEIVTI